MFSGETILVTGSTGAIEQAICRRLVTAVALAGRPIGIGRMAMPEVVGELVAFCFRPNQASLNGAVPEVNGGSHLR